jgi:hypothetical protein
LHIFSKKVCEKNIPFILYLLLFGSFVKAQVPSFDVGQGNPSTDFLISEILGELNSSYLVLVQEPTISVAGIGKGDPYKKFKISYFDKNTLSITKTTELPEFKGEGISKIGKTDIQFTKLNGDTIVLFTSSWDKDAKDYCVHVWELNANTLAPLTPQARLLSRIEDNGRNDTQLVSVEYFEFFKQFAIIYNEYKKKTKETDMYVIVLDSKLTPIRNEKLTIGGTKHGTGIADIDADKKGNIYFVNMVSEKSFPNWDDPIWMRVSIIPAGGGAISTNEIELQNGSAINASISVTPSGDVSIVGNYALMIDPKDGGKEIFGGSYIAKVSPTTGEILKVDELELTSNQKTALYVTSLNPNAAERVRYREIAAMKPAKLFVDEVGNTTLVSTARYSYTKTSNNRQYVVFVSNSMIVTKFSSAGEIAWQTLVPRAAFMVSANFAISPLVYFDKGKIGIIFNDDEENMDLMSQMASGKKPSSKSSSSKPSKPKDYPPTDTDEIIALENWNAKSTAIRHTIIDEKGFWKVNWLNPKGNEDSEKVPALEAIDSFDDSKGSIITSVYTKYGGLAGFKKYALARITLNQ